MATYEQYIFSLFKMPRMYGDHYTMYNYTVIIMIIMPWYTTLIIMSCIFSDHCALLWVLCHVYTLIITCIPCIYSYRKGMCLYRQLYTNTQWTQAVKMYYSLLLFRISSCVCCLFFVKELVIQHKYKVLKCLLCLVWSNFI